MTTGHIPGEVPGQGSGETQPGAANGARNAPGAPGVAGAPSEQEVNYPQNADPKDDASSPALGDPRRHEARPKRRRRLLAIGGASAALVAIISLWPGSIFLISLAGNRAATADHCDMALSCYRIAARINLWLEQWRVHFNLGTGRFAVKDLTSAMTTLDQALSEAPEAKVDLETKVKGAGSPERMVRANLYIVHLTLVIQAQESGSFAAVTEHIEAVKKVADACEMPPPSEQNPSPNSTPSVTPSSDPSSNPSFQPSSDPSSTPSATSNSDPSSSASPQPSNGPSSSLPSSSSPDETPSSTPSTKPTSTPADDRVKRLWDHNNGSPGTAEESGGSEGGGKPW